MSEKQRPWTEGPWCRMASRKPAPQIVPSKKASFK
jgi:hypothetical protein